MKCRAKHLGLLSNEFRTEFSATNRNISCSSDGNTYFILFSAILNVFLHKNISFVSIIGIISCYDCDAQTDAQIA